MITVSDLGLSFGGQALFSHVDLKFIPGNCYGVIGANGAGKSTFLKILSGELEPTAGSVVIPARTRLSVLKQDHAAFDTHTVLDTVLLGNPRLVEIMREKDELYAKEDFTDEDGERASHLEGEFAELNGWEADSDAARLLQGLGLSSDVLTKQMKELPDREKVKVLLAQALFGQPDILLLDEPTNGLDTASVTWLEDFLMEAPGTVIVVSHDRHFLNTICTHIVDVDFNKIKIYVGNYDFWYDSSQLMQRLMREQNRKAEEKIKDLQSFIERFSANKSKSRQATSRKKLLEKLTPEEMPASSRRYPFVGFSMDREAGKDILTVQGLCKAGILKDITFTINKGEKVAFVGENEIAVTALFQILMEKDTPDAGSFKWGVSTSQSYFPKDNTRFFEGCPLNMLQWFQQYATETSEIYARGFLGKMLFSGDDVYKPVKVLSGGEKVRCMLSRMMLSGANVLLLDQPTQHLDLESITALNNGLSDFKGNVLFSTYDRQLIDTVADRIMEILPDGTLIDKKMGFEEYLELRAGLI